MSAGSPERFFEAYSERYMASDFTTSYQLLRQEPDGWRILSYTCHDE